MDATEERAPGVYRVPEAAALLGISRGHAFELARRGELPGARRLGGRIVVVKAELERFLNGEKVTP